LYEDWPPIEPTSSNRKLIGKSGRAKLVLRIIAAITFIHHAHR
jgi:hypothetical protein